MSTRDENFDENFKDEHLQKALQHAPDSDVAPSEAMRKTVLDYADNALKMRLETRKKTKQFSWLSRLKKMFNSWQIPNWQLTGMGSLAASLLVVVMIWHENPDDPMQVATAPEAVQAEAAPKVEPELAQGELASDGLSKNQVEQSTQAAAEAAPTSTTGMEAKAKLESPVAPEMADKAVVAAAPEMVAPAPAPQSASQTAPVEQELAKDDNSVVAETRARTEAVPAASAPASDAVASASQKGALEKPAAAKKSATLDTAKEHASATGVAKAKQDIQAGVLRILVAEWPADKELVDEATGYRVELVDNLAPAELAAYNQTMRDWFKTQH